MTKPKNKVKKAKAKAKAQGPTPQQSPKSEEPNIQRDHPLESIAKESKNAPLEVPKDIRNEIMLSVHCGTMLSHANELKKVLLQAGYSVFLCDQMQAGEDFRDQISTHAAQCKAFIPFINVPWCNSRECGYEFKIALRRNLVNRGIPALLPLLLEDFKVYDDYPSVYGILCSTNGIRVDPSALGQQTWATILNALLMHNVPSTSSSTPLMNHPFPVVETVPSSIIPSSAPVIAHARTSLQDLAQFPAHVWTDILFFSDVSTLARWGQVATAFYFPAKRLIGGLVTTYAGSGKTGAVDGLAAKATFNDICGLAVDPRSGCLYVADSSNSKIRKIIDGIVSTYAGSGRQGSVDGPVAEASFKMPSGIAVDHKGNIFVADSWNCQIRKISADGIVSTYAGSGEQGSSDGPTAEATFNCPEGIVVDHDGAIYVADSKGNKIRKITTDGVVSTVAGSGQRGAVDGSSEQATFSYPVGLAISQNSEIYVADVLNHRIRKIHNGVVSTFAGKERGCLDGDVHIATFNKPRGIAVDVTDGSLLVVDKENHRIRKIDPKGRVSTLAGSVKGSVDGNAKKQAQFTTPQAIAVHAGIVYIAEEKVVRKLPTTPENM